MGSPALIRGLVVRTSGMFQVLGGQAAVSLANFLSILALGVWSGQEELGAYALGISCFLLGVSLADTLVATPYTYFSSRAERDGRDLEAVATLASLALAVAGALALSAACAFEVPGLSRLWPALPFAYVLFLMREWMRRCLVANGAVRRLLAVDCAGALLQLAGIVALGIMDQLTARSAMMVVGLASMAVLLPAVPQLSGNRLSVARRQGAAVLAGFFEYGRWLFLGGICHVGSVQLYPWLALIAGGERLAGLYAACAALVNLLGPLFVGLTNYFRPRFMAAWHAGDARSFVRYVALRSCVFVAPAIGVMVLAVFTGGDVLARLYGAEFRDAGEALAWMSGGMCAVAAGAAIQLGLLAMRAPVTNLYYHGVSLVLLVAAAVWLRERLDLLILGQLYGAINVIGLSVLGMNFVLRIRRS